MTRFLAIAMALVVVGAAAGAPPGEFSFRGGTARSMIGSEMKFHVDFWGVCVLSCSTQKPHVPPLDAFLSVCYGSALIRYA